MSNIRKFLPSLIFFFFIILLYFFFKKNNFDILKSISLKNFNFIILLSFFYLCTEAILLKNIVSLEKKISFLESLGVMSGTYFFNTFVQLSGLGFRIGYLKKKYDIRIDRFLSLSVLTIVCEIYIFSLLGIFTILINSSIYHSSNFFREVNYILIFINLICSLFFILAVNNFFLKKINNSFKIKFFKKVKSDFFINKKYFIYFCFKQIFLFSIQYILLFLIFFFILDFKIQKDIFFGSSLAAIFLDLSFVINLTPFSIGISEALTFFGTKNIGISFVQLTFTINLFKICILVLVSLFSTLFFMYQYFINQK